MGKEDEKSSKKRGGKMKREGKIGKPIRFPHEQVNHVLS